VALVRTTSASGMKEEDVWAGKGWQRGNHIAWSVNLSGPSICYSQEVDLEEELRFWTAGGRGGGGAKRLGDRVGGKGIRLWCFWRIFFHICI
jgi:hypothetical protein